MEKYIGYAESHDQALVGDKTIMFRLCDSAMYTDMSKFSQSLVIERGIALHKLIRLITLSLGGEGYLNFMGNEFGHPEWIDFPREGNGWSYFYCRRQWSLADDENLRYADLLRFDKKLISTAKRYAIFKKPPVSLYIDNQAKVLVYERNGLVFALNFHPNNSYEGYSIPVLKSGKYKVVLSTDDKEFGGWDRVSHDTVYEIKPTKGEKRFLTYLPARTGVCFARV
jgi:1,4-alpha-glucan branching enzyme